MKTIMITLFAGFLLMAASCTTSIQAAETGWLDVRRETLFLTDKMAYELHLNTAQYDDVYEINYDFLYAVRQLRDDRIGYFSDIRDEDLRWVLSNSQYRRFVQTDYFYRPIYMDRGRQHFRIYITYTNRNLYYFGKPHHYNTYRGEHRRDHHDRNGYYQEKYRRNDNHRDVRDNNHNNSRNDNRNDSRNVNRNDSRDNNRNDSRTDSRRESSDDATRRADVPEKKDSVKRRSDSKSSSTSTGGRRSSRTSSSSSESDRSDRQSTSTGRR